MIDDDSDATASARPFLLGVTGNIACGKSTVMRRLAELGAEPVDADVTYHELIEPGKPLWTALRDHFGEGIIAADRTIDRRALGRIVFSDPTALAELERITHPAIRAANRAKVAASNAQVVAIDAVKLIEGGMAKECDAVWLVVCDREQQIERLMARNGLNRVDAQLRVDAQPSDESKRAIVDVVIDNSGPLDATLQQIERAWREHPLDHS